MKNLDRMHSINVEDGRTQTGFVTYYVTNLVWELLRDRS